MPKESGKTPQRKTATKVEATGLGDCVVVGIGASAGGLKALTEFLSALDADTGMAFVVIQHLDPSHESLMSDLLGKHTPMDVVEVTGPCPLEPNRVYMIPPNKYLRIEDGELVLTEPIKDRGMRMPIDYFFRSLADQCCERCAAVVLTGTGSDGSQGLMEVKDAGGLTIAQQPDTAEYDGMPCSAIATGKVDLIVPIAEMPVALSRFARHPYVKAVRTAPHLHKASPDHFQAILSLLHTKTGYDFRCYKKGTLNRRIQRRMGLKQAENISGYLELLRGNREEIDSLFGDLLIGVTRFFRDRAVWDKLAEQVVRPLIARTKDGGVIRIWVPGCSTGEEAYTIAMIVVEEAERQRKSVDLQLFATDLDQEAVAIARAGVYPANIGLDLSQERLGRHFIQDGERFRVKKNLREACVFAAQNLIADPPFSNLDLISCRNLLIYLESSIQEKIIQLFHFALSPEGALVLGSSESTSKGEGLFEPVSKSSRIFRKKKRSPGGQGGFPIMPRPTRRRDQPPSTRTEVAQGGELGTIEFVRKVLLDEYAPAAILIDKEHSIHYFHGPLAPFLNTPSGQPSTNLFATLIRELEVKVRGLIRAADQKGETARATTQPLKHGGVTCPIRISVDRLQPTPSTTLFLITFEDLNTEESSSAGQDPAALSAEDSTLLQQLEYELQATREDLQSTIEELETSNEELKASNEEVMSMNEELQSTNEELETSREELQSLNEELSTVNSQLNEKLDELEASNNDLSNLLVSTQIATIFLDADLRIRRFTPSCRELLNIIPTDEGRPISDLSPRVNDPDLVRDAQTVLDKLQVSEREIRLTGDGWFLRRILPFRTADNQIDGVVITFTDIDAIKRTYSLLETRERQQACVARLGQLALAHREPKELFDRATSMLVDALDVGMSKVLKLDPDERSLTIVSGVGWDEKLVGDGKVPTGIESQAGYTLETRGPVIVTNLKNEKRFHGPELLTNHKVRSGLSVIIGPPDNPWGVIGAHSVEDRDFTEDDVNFFRSVSHILTEAIRRKEMLSELEESRERLVIAQEAADLGIHDFDVKEDRVYWDKRSRDFWGVDANEEITYQTFLDGIHKDDREAVDQKIEQLLDPDGAGQFYHEYRVINRKDKRIRWIAATAKAFFSDGKAYRAVGTHMDVTEKRGILEEQASWAERLEEQVIERTCLAEQRADDLRLLASQITTAEERARRKVAEVIHDDIQQLLIAAKMRLPGGPDELVTPAELEVVSGLLDRGLAQARSLVSELSPPVLQDGEFDKALVWLAKNMEKTHRLKVGLITEGNLEGLEDSLGTLLFNVVRELLFNVVKHAGTDKAEVVARSEGKMIEVEIKDSGKGFDAAGRSAESGGFGLFSIEERISAFGGTIHIESAPGKGARFLIRLPAMRRAPVDLSSKPSPIPAGIPPRIQGENLRILVVDDHEVVREGYVKILTAQPGYEVIATAGDGEEAVKLAQQHHPDLVLMDISMPKMNGVEATQMIKADREETVVIGLSLHEEGVLGESMRRAGASAYLQKDVAGSLLLGTIQELFPQTAQDS